MIFISCHVKLGVFNARWLNQKHTHTYVYTTSAEETSSSSLVTCLYSAINGIQYNTVVCGRGRGASVARDARAWHCFIKFGCAIASMSTSGYETVRDITKKIISDSNRLPRGMTMFLSSRTWLDVNMCFLYGKNVQDSLFRRSLKFPCLRRPTKWIEINDFL